MAQGPMAGSAVPGTALVAFPDRVRAVQQTPFGEITVVLNDGRGRLVLPGGQTQPAPPPVVSSVRDQLFLDPYYLFARLDDLEAEALEPVDGMDRVRVRAEGLSQPITLVLGADGRPASVVQVVDELPRTATGKVSKGRLRDEGFAVATGLADASPPGGAPSA